MMTWLPTFLILLCLLVLAWLAWGAGRANRAAPTLDDIHAALAQRTEALERSLRDEVARSAAGTRQELIGTLAQFQQALLAQQGDVTRTQNEQLDSFRVQLATMQQGLSDTLRDTTGHLNQQAAQAREAQDAALKRFADTLNQQLRELTEANERRSLEMRTAVEQKLADIQADNEKKLEQMRQTVDEKLHATLEQRLGESFKQVADRLEQVRTMVAAGEMPPRDRPFAWCESWCEFFAQCRDAMPETEEIVDPEIAAALEIYGQAGEIKSAADKEQKRVKALIDGVRGTARGWRVTMTTPSGDKQVPDLDQIEADYAANSLVVPTKTVPSSQPSLRVSRVKNG